MILAVTGLQRERRHLAGPDVEVVAGGGDQRRLEAVLERLAPGMRGVISIGIAGALVPGLRPGRWVVATAVRDDGRALPTDPDWTDWLVSRLPQPERGMLLTDRFNPLDVREADNAAIRRQAWTAQLIGSQ